MYYLCGHREIRPDLIEKELTRVRDDLEWIPMKRPSNRSLDRLFRRYTIVELAEMWYDSEPDIDYEHLTREQQYPLIRAYEERRIQFNNWIDIYGPGIWGTSQKEVDSLAKHYLKSIRNYPVKKKGRLFVGRDQQMMYIYWYGRDFAGLDLWWTLTRRDMR